MSLSGFEPVAAFEPLYGKPSWSVERGFGSFITMEFGNPVLKVDDEPRSRERVLPDGDKLQLQERAAHVHGEWHLWVYCCEWKLTVHDRFLAHHESDEHTMNVAFSILNGQALTSVVADPARGGSSFTFDLGCVLVTRPAPAGTYTEEPVDQWMLFQPSKQVLTLRGDGSFETGT